MGMIAVLDTRRPRLLLTVFCLLLWAPGLFTLPPGDRDESRFAQATKQMLETGDYVRIMNGTEARNRKPIGIHWLQAPFVALAQATGIARENPIWPYRIPSVLGGLAAVLACFGLGERLVGRRAGLLGAGLLAASVLLVTEVHIAKTDAALLGATTVAMAALGQAYVDPRGFGRQRAATFWLAMGAGVLLKGPITPMVVGLAVLSLVAADRRASWLRVLRAGWGVPLMLAVVIPWFAAIGVATGGRFFSDAVAGDLGRKLTSGDDAHGGLPGLHLVLLPLLLFPAAAALPGGVALAWRERRAPAVRFLLAWIVPAWLVFEATPTKLPHYTLPLYPAVCLLLASSLVSPVVGRRWGLLGAGLAGAGAVLLGVGGIAAPLALQMGVGTAVLLGGPVVIAAGIVGWLAMRQRAVVGALAAAPMLYGAILGWEIPGLVPLWLSPRIVSAVSGERLGAVGFAEPSLMFLGGTGTLWLRADEAATALAAGDVAALVVGDRDLGAVLAAARRLGVSTRIGAEVRGFNYSRGRQVVETIVTR